MAIHAEQRGYLAVFSSMAWGSVGTVQAAPDPSAELERIDTALMLNAYLLHDRDPFGIVDREAVARTIDTLLDERLTYMLP